MTNKILFVASEKGLTPSQTDMFKIQYGTLIEGCHHEDRQGYDGAETVTMSGIDTETTKLALMQVREIALKIVQQAKKVGATHLYCSFEDMRLTMWCNLYGYAQLGYPVKGDNQHSADWSSLASDLAPMHTIGWINEVEYWVKAL